MTWALTLAALIAAAWLGYRIGYEHARLDELAREYDRHEGR